MLIVISPAKRLDWAERDMSESEPVFRSEANRLAGHMRQLPLKSIKSMMSLSDDLARLNRDRFRAFEDDPQQTDTRPAVLAFAGDTYLGLEAASLGVDEMDWAQNHLRILSGLYGVLKPRDAIQPYRLEMGSRLKTRRGTNLYQFWGDKIAASLKDEADALGTDTLINCASQEYFGAVDLKALGLKVVTPVFLEDKGGTKRVVSFFAKKARGAMARFIIERRLTSPDFLADFDVGGYAFQADMSTPESPVFVRSEAGQDRLITAAE